MRCMKDWCSSGCACMCGAMTCAWRRRYVAKVSLAQRPLAFTVSRDKPRSRYSRVPPMQMLWPCRGVSWAARTVAVRRLRNVLRERGVHVVVLPFCFFCSEGISVGRRFVDAQVVDPGPVGVGQVCLRGPIDVLTCRRGLGERDAENGHILTMWSLLCAHVGWSYVQ